MFERILNTIKQSIDDNISAVPKGIGLILKIKIDKNLYDLDKIMSDKLKELIEKNLKKYIESKNERLTVKVKIKFNSVYVYDDETFIRSETLIRAWGKKLYEAYIDEPCTTRFLKNKNDDGYICRDFISMSRVRRIESSEMFQHDWKLCKRKNFDDRFKGFGETNYRPLNEDK